jgi:hypothetical protein
MGRTLKLSVLAVLTASLAGPALAGSADAQDAAAAEPTTAPAVDPKAMDALGRMGLALRTMKEFAVRADTTAEVVMEDGQKLEFAGTTDYKVRPPTGLFAEVKNDRKKRQYFYDGKTFTVYAPSTKYYATLPAPGTLGELVLAAQDYGLELPLADLFWWGTDKAPTSAITRATYVGPARLGERNVAHYAFRQTGVDWQVWLDGEALPRKLTIIDTSQAERPEYTAQLDWNRAPALSDASFTFAPPDGAYEIEFIPAVAAAAGKREEGKP